MKFFNLPFRISQKKLLRIAIGIIFSSLYADDCGEYNSINNTEYNCECNEETWESYYSYMIGCWLPNADLQNADLKWANFEGAYLVGADLRYAQMVTTKLSGANMVNANLVNAKLNWANLKDANMVGTDLRYVELENANLQGTNLEGANLVNANLKLADLRKANLKDASLFDADLSFGNLENAILDDAWLWYANLSEAFLIDASLKVADLRYANLVKSKLMGADFTDAGLFDAQLMNADLSHSNLQRANLQHADLSGALLEGTLLCDVVTDMDFKLHEWKGNPIWDRDCFGKCGGDMTVTKDKCGVCGGKDEPGTGHCDCLGNPHGKAVIDACGICGGTADGSDCNFDGIPDACEAVYKMGMKQGSSTPDLNSDGESDILDVVIMIEGILKK